MKPEMKELADNLLASVKSYVQRAVGGFHDRLLALESKEVKDGRDGVDGKDGKDGLNGKDGAQGESIYEMAKRNGFTGSEVEFLLSQKGEAGKDGRDGRDGRDGENGRDALDVTVLPTIDESRSYAKGTWASFKGGLWVARNNTNGMEGWDCVVNGYDSIELVLNDDFTFDFGVKMSTGESVLKKFSLPVVMDRGVFREGQLYKAGHAVTFGGSLWIAQEVTDSKPGTDDTWRLSVKKGRDGKDGKDGRDGRDGLNGKDWTGKRVD